MNIETLSVTMETGGRVHFQRLITISKLKCLDMVDEFVSHSQSTDQEADVC